MGAVDRIFGGPFESDAAFCRNVAHGTSHLLERYAGRQAHEDMHAEITGSTLAKFDNSAHFPVHTEMEAYLAAIRAWMATFIQ